MLAPGVSGLRPREYGRVRRRLCGAGELRLAAAHLVQQGEGAAEAHDDEGGDKPEAHAARTRAASRRSRAADRRAGGRDSAGTTRHDRSPIL